MNNPLDLEGEGKEFGHNIFNELPPINTETPFVGRETVRKLPAIHNPIHCGTPTQVDQNDTMIHEIQHVPMKCYQEKIRKLQETYPHYV